MNAKFVCVMLLLVIIGAQCQDFNKFSLEEMNENERFFFIKRMTCNNCQLNFGRIGCCFVKIRCCGYTTASTASTGASSTATNTG
ncbi:hypothetical protein CHUAL_013964 [Chamberlinius hualienensis]